MNIPVFISVGSRLTAHQQGIYEFFCEQMETIFDLDPRTVGKTDLAMRPPLNEVLALAQHCAGALILGFEEFQIKEGKRASKSEVPDSKNDLTGTAWSTPWNQIEAGICKALRLPMMIFAEGVSGGIFEVGSSDLFIQRLPNIEDFEKNKKSINATITNWSGAVQRFYYAGLD